MNPLQTDIPLNTTTHSPVIVALDFPDETAALAFVNKLEPYSCQLKIGNELFTSSGRKLVEAIIYRGFNVFLDLKYHDIPNTVQQACKMAAEMGVWMVNIHTSGGLKMMQAAAYGLANLTHRPILIGVTVLTSLDEADLQQLGINKSLREQVLYLSTFAQQAGLDGVVCSAQEVEMLKNSLGRNFITVTPGIRFNPDNNHDQKRVMTPEEAIRIGTDYMVIGRPITQAQDPALLIHEINLVYQHAKETS